MVGTDKKNENSVAVFRFNPSKSPPIIVAPDLETPGNIERTWKRPIFRDCEIDKLSTSRYFGLILIFSTINIAIPPAISAMAIEVGLKNNSLMIL